MFSNAFLYKEKNGIMHCECPECSETVFVCENDRNGKTPEYFVRCDECGNWFNASTDY